MSDVVLHLAAGESADVECGRSGAVTDMNGQTITFTPENLAALAETLDPEESLVKCGHTGPVASDAPLYGNVKALRYDVPRDRLLATFVPTPALVRRNREEKFAKASMELAGTPPRGPFRFLHLALLAARRPAISGLAPVLLAAPDGATEVLVQLSAREREMVDGFVEDGGSVESSTLFVFALREQRVAAAAGAPIDLLEAVRRVELAAREG